MLPPLSLRRGPFRVRQGRCSSSARCQQDSGHHLRRRRRARFVTLPMRETTLALRHTNALFTIAFDGNTKMAVVKDVQKNPVKRIIEHVDFLESRPVRRSTSRCRSSLKAPRRALLWHSSTFRSSRFALTSPTCLRRSL